jgi:hypothetical protein
MEVSPASPLSPGIRANGHLDGTYSIVDVKYITEEVPVQTAILALIAPAFDNFTKGNHWRYGLVDSDSHKMIASERSDVI